MEENSAVVGPSCAVSPSKKRIHSPAEEPQSSTAVVSKEELENSLDEGITCSICFELYTNSGPHRLTCLKCGHLFGKRCITKWLTTTKPGYCPQCKRKSKLSDIREHYCRGIKVLDTTEKEEALNELQKEREAKRLVLIENATLRQKYESLAYDMRKLQEERQRNVPCPSHSDAPVGVEKRDLVDIPNAASNVGGGGIKLVKRLDVCREGDSRVMCYVNSSATLCVSGKQGQSLFMPYGIKKIDMHNLRSTDFIPLHTDVVRDVKCDGFNALTASFDKTLVLSSMQTNCRTQKWNVGHKVWCCCFKSDEANYVFCATQNGKVKMYDKRMTFEDQPEGGSLMDLCDLQKPIFSLQWLDDVCNSRGLLVTSIDRCIYFAQLSHSDFRPHVLPAEGKLYSAFYNGSTRHLLISYGPSTNKRQCVEHSLYEMAIRNNDPVTMDTSYTANLIRTFNGGAKQTLMCRNLLFENPKDRSNLMAAVFDESSNSIQLWDASAGQLSHRLPVIGESLYDIGFVEIDNNNYICLLNHKSLSVHSIQ